jgi:hypothetical protein
MFKKNYFIVLGIRRFPENKAGKPKNRSRERWLRESPLYFLGVKDAWTADLITAST